jgi:hypothetical protein
MEKDKEITEVIFRKFRNGEIIALFPYLVGFRYGDCMSYMHVGQHSEASLGLISGDNFNDKTTLAKPDEYKDLQDELINLVGYNLKVLKKMSWRKYSKTYHSQPKIK